MAASNMTRYSVKPEMSHAFSSFKVLIPKELVYFTLQYFSILLSHSHFYDISTENDSVWSQTCIGKGVRTVVTVARDLQVLSSSPESYHTFLLIPFYLQAVQIL
jgi:hypothetical protein